MIENFPMIEACIIEVRMNSNKSSDQIIEAIRMNFDITGPYQTAKKYGMIVGTSAEEFAIQWMSFYNQYSGKNHY